MFNSGDYGRELLPGGHLPNAPIPRLKVIFLFVLLAVVIGCTAKRREPRCFVFPQDYVGWVSIEYGKAESITLPEREGCVWIDFREGPDLQTSYRIQEGWAADRYFQDRAGQLVPIRDGNLTERAVQEHFYRFTGVGKTPDGSKEYLFIGTAQDLKLSPPPDKHQRQSMPEPQAYQQGTRVGGRGWIVLGHGIWPGR